MLTRIPPRRRAALIGAIVGALTAVGCMIGYIRTEDFKFGSSPEFILLLPLNILPVLAMMTWSVVTDWELHYPVMYVGWLIINTAGYAAITWLLWPRVQRLKDHNRRRPDQTEPTA